ncbi:hypothetical protein Bhyg_03198 [Pseudolycoriella hygida]|uniref:MULE transposase domain-containing protein n=1 Tax=Pseudolycoriella hygida TaxID=35572 RepID=A0A9Q0NCW8_9DIPT|nr:hypothetical protein Bhyg_03198 [Pseudolycoriella hygida]
MQVFPDPSSELNPSKLKADEIKPDQSMRRNDNVHLHHLGSNNYRDSQCYLYTKNNCRKSNLYLRCKNSIKHNCPARITVRNNNFEDATLTILHNHPPDQQLSDNQIFDIKLEENVNNDPFATPREIYLKTKAELVDKIDLTNVPSLKKKESFIRRRQRKYVPLLPATVEEFEKYITDPKYSQFFTNDSRNLPYYRGIWTSAKGERNVAFISETILRVINTMNHISLFMDGTYKALPHHIPFRQLYVVNVTFEGQCYPLAYIFMETKTFSAYDTVFQNLKLLMTSVEVAKLMTDYEAASRKALKKHYPNARMSGCFFHYVQAIVKSTKRFGLRSDERFKDTIKHLCVLALLPNDYVIQGFECIDSGFKDVNSTRWDAFRKYWMKQWAKANISVYGLVDRSNNFSESNNKSLNLLLKKTHPNIWYLIKTLKLLEMDKSHQITRATRGEMIVTKRSKDMIRLNEKIVRATNSFEEDLNVSNFLKRAAFEENLELYVKNQVNIMDDDHEEIDNENNDEIIPNDYDRESDFQKNHPRDAASKK